MKVQTITEVAELISRFHILIKAMGLLCPIRSPGVKNHFSEWALRRVVDSGGVLFVARDESDQLRGLAIVEPVENGFQLTNLSVADYLNPREPIAALTTEICRHFAGRGRLDLTGRGSKTTYRYYNNGAYEANQHRKQPALFTA